MGVEYSAAIIVGLSVDEFDSRDEIEELELDVVAPYYDGDKDGIAGCIVRDTSSYDRCSLNEDGLMQAINQAKEDFKTLTGKDGILYLSTRGY